ncbi:MAG: hypothetical protein AUJ71_01880 [Candidatus Omnitrophica bacterium CG1_02_49_16]|nr:MAG: hypothetical protein AUJ71_01880 [Candidatus Omnitrophica bacterium CG1_02_49_16]
MDEPFDVGSGKAISGNWREGLFYRGRLLAPPTQTALDDESREMKIIVFRGARLVNAAHEQPFTPITIL